MAFIAMATQREREMSVSACTCSVPGNECWWFPFLLDSAILEALLHVRLDLSESDALTGALCIYQSRHTMINNALKTHTTTVLRPFFRDHPGEPVPEQNFWTLWCKGRLTEAECRHIDHLDGHHSIRTKQCPPPLHHPPLFTGRMPFLPPNQQCQSTEGN